MVGSSSASPPQVHAELQDQQDRKESVQKYKRSPEIIHRQPPPRHLQSQYTQPREDIPIFGHLFEREYLPYTQQPHHPISTVGGQFGDYLVPVPVMPGTVYLQGAVKQDDTMSPFNMSYPEIDHTSHRYEDSNPRASTILSHCYNFNVTNSHPQTPPLSHPYEHSTVGSDSSYQQPAAPLSMHLSPRLPSQI
jgi:hypothetical protein